MKDRVAVWSPETNPGTGKKFKAMLSYFQVAHNGNADIDRYIDSEYGEEIARRLQLQFKYEEDPFGEECLSYYRSKNLKKYLFQNGDYYTRWVMLAPLEIDEPSNTKKYPVIFVHHGGGNSIEYDEFLPGYQDIAGIEKFIVVYLQNTNWENVSDKIEYLKEHFPVDQERIYLVGYSQGGYEVTSAYFRIPEKLAGAAPCGNDIYREWDNFNVPYLDYEVERLKKTFVPFMQIVGACEASGFAPVNDWHPRKDWGTEGEPKPYIDPRTDDGRDPTRVHGGKRRFSNMPEPPENQDKHEWMISRLNKRMDTLGCARRDADICIGYLHKEQDELHHAVGFYGDKEETQIHYGYKHYVVDIKNQEGMDAFRYVVVENSPHAWPLMTAYMTWDFFRNFRRDTATGKIVVDRYQA